LAAETASSQLNGVSEKMKVIHILPYSSLVTGKDFKVDLFADGYHVRVAQQIWKRTKKYQQECWRPERMLKEAISGEKDGIVYRAFPSFRPTLGSLDKFVYKGAMATFPSVRLGLWREYSLSLLKELKRECQREQVLIHIYHMHFDLSYLICLCLPDVPIVGWHIGDTPYTHSFSSFIYHLPLSLVERKALGNVDAIFVGTKGIYDAFHKCYKSIPRVVTPMPFGVDFEQLKPLVKEEAKKSLGIPADRKVIFYVGRFDSAKGFDLILKVYRELKSSYDVELIAIGGLKTDPLYNEAVESGATVHEWMAQAELIPYYSAADVYLFPKFYSSKRDENIEKFMGLGMAPRESLVCGTPVVGTNLKYFLGDGDELRKIGIIPADPEDVIKCVSEVFEHPDRYRNCREITAKYYSWGPVVQRIVDVYDELFDKYYK
jgi:D-inositol-3-phosphate glycosyltransferase